MLIRLISCILLTHFSVVMADTLDVAKIHKASISLTSHLGILEDKDQTLTFEEIQKERVQFKTNLPAIEAINLSYTASAFWLRFNFDNSSNESIEKVIEINQSLLENVDFYWQTQGKTIKTIHTGYAHPFQNRAYKTRVFAFPLMLKPHSQNVIYIRVASPNAMNIPVRLWNLEEFQIKDRNAHVFQGVYFGILFAIAIFSLAMAMVLKELDYVIYVCIIFSIAMSFMSFRGLGTELIWQDSPEFTKVGTLLFSSFAAMAQLFFIRRILDVRTLIAGLESIMTGVMFLLLCISIGVVLNFTMTAKYSSFVLVGYEIFILGISFIGVLKQRRSARFLFVGLLMLTIGFITSILYALGFLPSNTFTMYSSQIGSALELLIFTLLLTDRYQLIHFEKLQSDRNLEETNLLLLAEIEERKDSEKRQVALTHQLNQMQKLESIGRLTSGISHDFNNLLMAISGYNDLNKLSAKDLTPSPLMDVENIKNELLDNSKQIDIACYKAKKLIAQMLSYCRRDQSEAVENPVFNVNNEIHESLDMIRKMIPSTIQFELNLSDKIIPLQQLDESKFNQIIVNLCVNASHAIASAKGTIQFYTGQTQLKGVCSCCQKHFEGNFVEIRVSDNGSGIDPVVVKRIFEPFYTTKEVGEGTGLGLSVIAGIVHNANGYILLESEVGVGTTFRMLFAYQ